MIGTYSPNSLAATPRRAVGGVRRQGESPEGFRARMDGNKMVIGQPRAMPISTRADNIAAARADGTFDAKRNAFNASNSGSYMNEQGIIGPRAPSPTGGVATPPIPTAPAAPTQPPAPPPTAQIGKPRKPATFDGKSMADFKAQYATGKQVETPVTGMAPAFRAPNGEWKTSPERIAASRATSSAFPARSAPSSPIAAVKPTPMSGPGAPTLEKRAQALQNAARLSAEGDKIIAANKATRKPMNGDVPGPIITSRLPTVNHASPVKQESKPKATPAHLLFANRAPPATPAPVSSAPRAIDSYVTGPKNKSIMTGKTGTRMAEEEAKAKKKAAAEKLFRRPYMPNRPASLN